jgi:hypothetical protein
MRSFVVSGVGVVISGWGVGSISDGDSVSVSTSPDSFSLAQPERARQVSPTVNAIYNQKIGVGFFIAHRVHAPGKQCKQRGMSDRLLGFVWTRHFNRKPVEGMLRF